jgi:L-threonylcarbamoyladenylate synthase
VIRAAGVVAAPTDTLVGLLALATSDEAVRRVLAIKGPGREAPLPVLLPDVESVQLVAEDIRPIALRLAERLWPGPLTLVLRAKEGVLGRGVASASGTVGVRVPGPSPALEVLRAVRAPLTGTSANQSGHPAPVATDDIEDSVLSAVDLVLPGRCAIAAASAVVDVTGDTPRVLRKGPGIEGLLV